MAQFAEQIAEINGLMATWKRGELERRARLGGTFVELLRADDGRRSRHVLRGIEALVFVLADGVTSVGQLHERLGRGVEHEELVAAIRRLTDTQALVRCGDRVVASIAYAGPHTDAELRAWAARNGLPAREADDPPPVAGAPSGEAPRASPGRAIHAVGA
jgi:hypothetical protein